MGVLPSNHPLSRRNVLIAVTGSVAACKADRVIRLCQDYGAEVRVLLTESGAQFFPPQLAGALTEQEVYTTDYDTDAPGRMTHIELKRWADVVLVAPATANRLLEIDSPRADDLLSTVLRAFDGPVTYAPAMNPDMWTDPAIQDVVSSHHSLIIEPSSGEMACGDVGPGRFPAPERIVERLVERLWPDLLDGENWVVSGGPTVEPWDDVRVLTNRSSGRMGAALARTACWLGAEATLVTGSNDPVYPEATNQTVPVGTAREMRDAVLDSMEKATGYVGAAAVSNYRPRQVQGKVNSGSETQIPLEENPDIIESVRSNYPDTTIVGFSYDDANRPDRAVEKAVDKDMDAVVFNSLNQADGGMESSTNRAWFCRPSGDTTGLGRRPKLDLATQIWLILHVP